MVRPVEEENLEVDWNGSFNPIFVVDRAFLQNQLRVEQVTIGDCRPQQAKNQRDEKHRRAASCYPEFLMRVRATSHRAGSSIHKVDALILSTIEKPQKFYITTKNTFVRCVSMTRMNYLWFIKALAPFNWITSRMKSVHLNRKGSERLNVMQIETSAFVNVFAF